MHTSNTAYTVSSDPIPQTTDPSFDQLIQHVAVFDSNFIAPAESHKKLPQMQ